MQAQRGHVARREGAPPREDGRQRPSHLPGPELHQARPAPLRERRGEARRHRLVQAGRICGLLQHEMAVRRQTKADVKHWT